MKYRHRPHGRGVLLDQVKFLERLSFNKDNGCLEWAGALFSNGYGAIAINGKNKRAHRFSYELFIGPIPDTFEIDHLCKNVKCVHPLHLEAVTHHENMRRSSAWLFWKNKKSCKNNHPFTEKNTYIDSKNKRKCRMCSRIRNRKYLGKTNVKTYVTKFTETI